MTKRRRIPPEVRKLFQDARNLSGSSAPRKHHLVPASYLRRWADRGQIRVTDVNERRDYKTSPEKAARQTDFYRAESEDVDPNEMPPLLFELLLSHIEQWGKRAIDQLIQAPNALNAKVAAEFAWYLAMQFTRGAAFRAELEATATAVYRIQYDDLSDEVIRRELARRGVTPTDELVTSSRRLFDGLKDGSVIVAPQQAAMLGLAGEAAAEVGEHFLTRGWVVVKTARVMLTCDEPVVLLGGPGSPRDERAGVATAGVVLLPLDPGHVLALFRSDVAEALGHRPLPHIGTDELDGIETVELCREVAMSAHRWTFERPTKRVAVKLSVPPAPEAASTEEVDAVIDDDPERRVIRTFRRNRWYNADIFAPWPVRRWWDGTEQRWTR